MLIIQVPETRNLNLTDKNIDNIEWSRNFIESWRDLTQVVIWVIEKCAGSKIGSMHPLPTSL